MRNLTFKAEVSSAVAPVAAASRTEKQEEERVEKIREELERQGEAIRSLGGVRDSLRFLAKVAGLAGQYDHTTLDADDIYGLGQLLHMLYDKMMEADESLPLVCQLESLFGVKLEGRE